MVIQNLSGPAARPLELGKLGETALRVRVTTVHRWRRKVLTVDLLHYFQMLVSKVDIPRE